MDLSSSDHDHQFDDLITATSPSSDHPSIPPDLQPSDYVEIGLLFCMVIVGAPLNLVSLLRALRMNTADVFRCCLWTFVGRCVGNNDERRQQDRGRRLSHIYHQRPLTLRFHLTVANLLVLCVYSVSQICWLSTYEWKGGNLMCRLVRFVHAFCFYATSNLMAAIGIDRLHVTVYVDRPKARANRSRLTSSHDTSVRWLASIAWTVALVSSLPQLFVWGTFQPFADLGWSQCVTVWTMKKYYNDVPTIANNETNDQATVAAEINYQEKLYDGLHLALVFWIPAIFITVSYALIVTRFNWNIRKTSRQQQRISFSADSCRPSIAALPNYEIGNNCTNDGNWRKTSRTTKAASVPNTAEFALNMGDSSRSTLLGAVARTRHASTGAFVGNVLRRASAARLGFGGASRQHRRQRHVGWESGDHDRRRTEPTVVPNRQLDQSPPLGIYTNGLPTVDILQHKAPIPNSFAVITLTRARSQTVRKTVWILLAYFLFWTPYNSLALYRYFYPTFEHSYLEIMYNLIVLNAVVNPLIYGI